MAEHLNTSILVFALICVISWNSNYEIWLSKSKVFFLLITQIHEHEITENCTFRSLILALIYLDTSNRLWQSCSFLFHFLSFCCKQFFIGFLFYSSFLEYREMEICQKCDNKIPEVRYPGTCQIFFRSLPTALWTCNNLREKSAANILTANLVTNFCLACTELTVNPTNQ